MSDKPKSLNPATVVTSITPHDTNDLSPQPRSLYIGVGGDVEIVDAEGGTRVFKNVASGSVLPVAPVKLKDANTTATDILGLL